MSEKYGYLKSQWDKYFTEINSDLKKENDISFQSFSKKIKDKFPHIEIILLTAYGNIPDSVQAIKNGAFDYITKGDDNNKIIPL